MAGEQRPKRVHVVTHGPACLDGTTAAVVVARYYREATVFPQFSTNVKINETLLNLPPPGSDVEEVWITDISWTDPAVDRHLQELIDAGVRVFWIDHHRTALERHRRGAVKVQFTGLVLSDELAASRLTYDYLGRRLRAAGEVNPWFDGLARLVALADDNDRWVHRLPGSRQLGLVVSLLGLEAYAELLNIDPDVSYTPRMRAAQAQLQAELQRTFEVAERSRHTRHLPHPGLDLVTAVCDGYPSEVADEWGKTASNTVFALFDARSLTVSLRRSPDCSVDLSQLAERLGGGGHPAAAGCEIPELRQHLAEWLAGRIVPHMRIC